MPTIDKNVARYEDNAGIRRRYIGGYTGPASYATGGDPFTADDVGMKLLEHFIPELAVNSSGTVRGLQYDHANGKVRWIVLDTGSEVSNGTDLSGFSARFEAVGY